MNHCDKGIYEQQPQHSKTIHHFRKPGEKTSLWGTTDFEVLLGLHHETKHGQAHHASKHERLKSLCRIDRDSYSDEEQLSSEPKAHSAFYFPLEYLSDYYSRKFQLQETFYSNHQVSVE